MILNNLPCGFIPGGRAGVGCLGRKPEGLHGPSLLLSIYSVSPFPLLKDFCFHIVAPNTPAFFRAHFLLSRAMFHVFTRRPAVLVC